MTIPSIFCIFHRFYPGGFTKISGILGDFRSISREYPRNGTGFPVAFGQDPHKINHFFIYNDTTEIIKIMVCYAWNPMGVLRP
jgi:hypothetical protein